MSYAPIGSELTVATRNLTRDQPSLFPRRNLSRSKSPPRKRNAGSRARNDGFRPNYPIIVHCHLCWNWVWQRPQQFISRISERHPVLFVETLAPDPQLSSPCARFSQLEDFPNVTVLQLQFPSWRWSDGRYVDRERRRLVKEFLSGPGKGRFDAPVQWFYDPMTVPAFAGQMREILTVYDCMDELSQFRGAPPDIVSREAELLARADVVFTGGRKLYESKSRSNDNCHFHGCGVDLEHFASARKPETQVPEDMAPIRRPALGYFGVVDERMDYELIARLAEAQPDWSFVFVGPTLKVNDDILPRRPNIHWLGQRPYAQLPAYCKGLDVCLMPFALNEATEFINPTKALEYMATGRPIVSSAVPDVVRNFGSIVSIARSHDEFLELCRRALEQADQGAIEHGFEMAAANSWESVVAQLEGHIEEALVKKQTAGVAA
jgi:glycosyltransferase involved in cell wall biosynthesis